MFFTIFIFLEYFYLFYFYYISFCTQLFDEENALTDPRANGEDSSVGIVEIPLGCCLKLIEILLVSSHAIPPACRTVGQFYVSFLLI